MTYYSAQQIRLLPQLVPANYQEYVSLYDFRSEEEDDDFDDSQEQNCFNNTNFSQDRNYSYRRSSSASSVASTVSSQSSQDSPASRDFLTKKLHQNLVEKKLPDLKEFDDSLTNLNWLQTMNPMKLENCKSSQDNGSLYPHQNYSSQNNSIMDPEERLDYRTCAHIKPPYSYASLICMAMRDLGRGKITLSDIYSWITENFMYYRMADSSWQNSVRHNLSLNKCFEKVPRRKDEPGKGGFWRINPKYADVLENGLNKRRRTLPQLVNTHCSTHSRQNCHARLFSSEKHQKDSYSTLPPTNNQNPCSNTSNSLPVKRPRCAQQVNSNTITPLQLTATGMPLSSPLRRRALPKKIPSIVRPEYRTAESSDKVDTQMRYMGGPVASSLQQFNCSLNQESFMDSSIMLSCGNTLPEEDFTEFLDCCSPTGQQDSSSSSGVGEVCSDIGSDELDLNQMKEETVVCESTESCEVMWDDLNSMLGLN